MEVCVGVTQCVLVEKSGSCRAAQPPVSQQGCSAAVPHKHLPPPCPLMALSSLTWGSPRLPTAPFKLSLEPLSPSLPWACSALTLPPAQTVLVQVISLWDEPLDEHLDLFPGWVLILAFRGSFGVVL